ncbi:MAG: BspA family leucine-rich repeat surface protein, partial [Myxococcota bacterium]|nr:BspA family leucine-rich repeat surface protein [Myxococcota bacterium]
MFEASGMSRANYDATLVGWEALATTPPNVPLGALGIEYCAGEIARAALINTHGWTISGDTKNCAP